MSSLYEIKEEYLKALESIEVNEDGEIVNYEEIESLSGAFDDKAEAVACFILNEESMAESIKAREKEFAERRKAHENKAERLKKYLSDMMNQADKSKLETPNCRIGFRKSNAVEIKDESLIPEWYKTLVTETKVDKKAIAEAFKSGTEVAGCEYVTRQNINIK